MNTPRILMLSILVLCATANADETKPPKHNPEWTNPTTGDPGQKVEKPRAVPVESVASELQGIVVLCAKDPESPEFRRAWSGYVVKHGLSGDKLQSTIQKVVNEAFKHRQEYGQQQGTRMRSANWKDETSKAMHDTAMAVIRKIG